MKKFSKILFVADLETDNTFAFEQALTIAENNQSEITVLGVGAAVDFSNDKASTIEQKLQESLAKRNLRVLDSLTQSATKKSSSIKVKVLSGKAYIEIIREVIRSKRDLLIKSADVSESISGRLFGSLDDKLIRMCPCPVWLIKPLEQQGYREVLVGLDYDPDNKENEALNKQLLDIASSLAIADGSELHIVHAWEYLHESFLRSPRVDCTEAEVDEILLAEENKRRSWLKKVVKDFSGTLSAETIRCIKLHMDLIKGQPSTVILTYAKEKGVEQIVMGTIGRSGLPGYIIGNTAENILNQVDCSILAVKPQGFKSPVTLGEE